MNAKKKNILIAEDNYITLLDLQQQIESNGYNIIATASSGDEVIKKALKYKPDLILMDIKLKGDLTGIDASNEIAKYLDIPIIYTTAYTDKKTIKNAQATYPYGYLAKPFQTQDLYISIEMAFNRHEFNKKLQENEYKYRSLFEESQDAIFILDNNGYFKDFNNSMTDMFGYKKNELKDSTLELIFSNSYDYRKVMNKISQQGYIKSLELKLRKKNGDEKFCIISSNSLKTVENQITGYQGIIKDIDKIQKVFNGIVQAISLTIEVRDPYTAGHQKRVANLAYAIALELDLPFNVTKSIKISAQLHDLGKIIVPSEILTRPGKITETEFSIIKTHAQVGYDIIKQIEFPWPLAEIILQHHEKINGSGYPRGLPGKDILLEAKILTVADVVEAMSSHRPYRPAKKISEAINELEKNKGILYDTKVVEACLNLIINKKYKIDSF